MTLSPNMAIDSERFRARSFRRLGASVSLTKGTGGFTVATQAEIQSVVEAVESGSIAGASYAQLVTYSAWLTTLGSHRMITANFDEISKIVHLHLTRSVIEAFEKRSKVQGWATLVFAVLAITATLMPYFIAPSPNSASSQAPTTSAAPLNTPQAQSKSQLSAPIQPLLPSSGPATKKTP